MLSITIRNQSQNERISHESGPLEFGRGPQREIQRFVVLDPFFSRNQLIIEPTADGRVRLENLGATILLGDGRRMNRGVTLQEPLPVSLTVGYTQILVEAALATAEVSDPMLDVDLLQTVSAPRQSQSTDVMRATARRLDDSPSAERLAQWFETLLTVQKAAAGTGQFYEEAARAVVDLIGLDAAMMLLREGDKWRTAATVAADDTEPGFSLRVLNRVVKEGRTFYQGDELLQRDQSLMNVQSFVASPIFNETRDVIGALYGVRRFQSRHGRLGIRPLEAQLVQLVAGSVGVGLTRRKREEEAARTRLQFESFCSPELARALEMDPTLLDGQRRIITVMFCDIRGFSAISEQIGPEKSFRLVSQIMDPMTDLVIRSGGSIIDYQGDGLAAMWNAPFDQQDHQARACQAALEIQEFFRKSGQSPLDSVVRQLKVGVGLHCGAAFVGNAGSQRRLKYGPSGPAVNLTSRLESSTKYFGVPIIISGEVRGHLTDEFATRRLCQARLPGFRQPVELYELHCPNDDAAEEQKRRTARDAYERALQLFEQREFPAVPECLAGVARDWLEQDPAAQWLAENAARCCQETPEDFEPVLTILRK